jgi:hypothetical protein
MAMKSTLVGVLGKAIVDPQFRAELLNDRNAVAEQYGLSSSDRDALNRLDGSKLTDAAKQLGNKAEAKIEVVIGGHFDAK